MESNHQQEQEQEEVELFDIKKLQITPDVSQISEAVEFTIQFQVKQAVPNPMFWKVNYIIDSTGKRVINELVISDKYTYNDVNQVYTVQLKTPKIEVDKVPRKTLLNVGLLQIKAYQVIDGENQEELSMNMVVHVSKDKSDESILLKTVLNPLE
ncbi:UNKNOWN [Stylonychia lemnae]|uniref:Uncharacterized protein n=1 Tax=Stylonychia lemnae TaxID=5949 RepID=A0A078AJM3_STYLE|nr:UNKNOWN [Stylonychia lemnae]|eukprot:CDW82570.1 UNKNOWN [Stylonychia lemnae]